MDEARTEEETLVHYREIRDGIRAFVERLPELLEKEDGKENAG